MKKIVSIFLVLFSAVSFSVATAQITGGGVQVVCIRYNLDGTCAQTGVTGGVQIGGPGSSGYPPTGGQGVPPTGYPTGGPSGVPQTGGVQCPAGSAPVNVGGQISCQQGSGNPTNRPAYYQGQNTRQIGSQQVDLSFVNSILGGVGGLVRMLPAILIGLAVAAFFWFLVTFIFSAKENVEKKQSAQKRMMWSLIAIFIMVTLWGIIAFFGDAIGINPNVGVSAPALPL